jgi:clan AA aspartic protease (TIGR02281 family)
VLTAHPEYGFGYYRRGWFKELVGDMEGAIEDLSMSIVLDPDYSYSYVSRGDIYMKQGKKELAEADFKKVIEIEDTPDKYDCIHYAYQGLGENAKAIAAMDSIIARDSTDSGNYYDAACLYSRMQDKGNALRCLEKCLELGYNRFAHIERDFDMDFLRETDEFKALITKYKSASSSINREQSNNVSKKELIISEIPFTKEDGICKVKCQINGLPLHFVFDTGASDVTLSMVEATFMMKNGYLSKNDVIGNQRYMDANGDVNVGTVINIKNVNFGGLDLNNIRASVVRNQKAPLLLGQSVLARLGKIEIDNAKKVIKITQY